MKIYLVRHGESVSDVRQKYDGEYDDSLTDQGKKEAEEIARKLSTKGVQIIFSSSRRRALETAEAIRSILACELRVDEKMNEQNIYGAYPELSIDQPEEEYRRLGELITDRDMSISGVETYQQLKQRVSESLQEIISLPYEAIAIITHGGPIRSIVRDVLKQGELKNISNGTMIELEATGSDLRIIHVDGAVLQEA